MSRRWTGMAALALAFAWSPDAAACGGFFCNALEPVDQAGEDVVFAVDDDEGVTTMHVRVTYQGPAEDFAWVVPVPADPQIEVGTEALFDLLKGITEPLFFMDYDLGSCESAWSDTDTDADADADVDTDVDSDGSPGVEVLSTSTVGPYDTVVLRADSAGLLVAWLTDNGYAVPDALVDAAAPYVSETTSFLALKLTKGATTGDIAPLVLTYASTRPAIPIGMTALAATADMPMSVYLLGAHRGVPLNYLHVQPSPLAFPWDGGGGVPWSDLAGLAADETGGRAFTTAYSGAVTSTLWRPGQLDTTGMDLLDHPLDWFAALDQRGFPGTDDVLEVLRVHLPAPDDVDEVSFYNCTSCYADAWEDLAATFDPVTATFDLEAMVVTPRKDAQALLDAHLVLTRLDTQLSPHEMSVDPMFGFNPELPDVPRERFATVRYLCEPGTAHGEALRQVEWATGETLVLPAADQHPKLTLSSSLTRRVEHYAMVVEQLAESGPPVVLADYSDELSGGPLLVDPLGRPLSLDGAGESGRACSGCSQAPAAAVGGFGLAALVLAGRRRR